MQRWDEEVIILREEFKRIHRSFTVLGEGWQKAGESFIDKSAGHIAYARERASMYCEMAAACKADFLRVEKRDLV